MTEKTATSELNLTDLPLMIFLRKRGPSIALLIFVLLLVNLPALSNGFTNWDDPEYVLLNEYIRYPGWDAIFRMFTSSLQGNYHPLVQLSYAIDYTISGNQAWMYHAQNIFWHLVNVMLVYRIFRRMGHNRTKGWLVALFFGLHPLHAESVAWISARKDVMYAAGFLFSVLYYYRFCMTGKVWFYRLSLAGFIWACLCKPMAISLPLVLILIDYFSERKASLRERIFEKFPFFFLALVLGWFTFLAQVDAGAVSRLPGWDSLWFSATAFLFYVTKTILPFRLSAYYPYPDQPDFGDYTAPIFLIVLLFAFYRWFRLSKITVFGWGFFFVCLLPVLQLLPAGNALAADRYHYVAGLGMLYMVVELSWIAWYRYQKLRNWIPILGLLTALGFGTLYVQRLTVWTDDEHLYADMLKHNPNLYMANHNLGMSRYMDGRYQEALQPYRVLTQVYPDSSAGFEGTGKTLARMAQYDSAIHYLQIATRLNPGHESLYNELGIAWFRSARWDSAAAYFQKTLQQNTKHLDARNNLAMCYLQTGRDSLAEHTLYQVMNIDSTFGPAYYNMALVWQRRGNQNKTYAWLKAAADREVPEAQKMINAGKRK